MKKKPVISYWSHAMVDEKRIIKFSNRIVQKFHPQKIILFGSYATGTPSPDSDVDVLVILHFEGNNALKAAEILNQTDPHFPIDLLVRKPEEIQERLELGDFFLRDILSQGKVMYEATYA